MYAANVDGPLRLTIFSAKLKCGSDLKAVQY
jgi:hypothetical protein